MATTANDAAPVGSVSCAGRQRTAKRGARKFVIKTALWFLVMPWVLFPVAGSWTWTNGWILYATWFVNSALTIALLLPRSPDLLAERAGPQDGMKKWDLVLVSLAATVLPLVSWIVAALEFRYRWVTPMSLPLVIAGTVTVFAGFAFMLWAMVTNAFFSAVVRIQKDRGHRVVSDGPYGCVRHPGYVGWILSTLGMPLLLGSWWAWVPAAVMLIIIPIRTGLEDRTLHRELDGYPDYAKRVRYRLCPGIW